jgi:hypothetical protein
MTRRDSDGHYAASVSIRSGRGSMTHDRVMRFVPVFESPALAQRFAIDQALAWIGAPARAATPINVHQEEAPWPRKN